jgi:hypothetical protein
MFLAIEFPAILIVTILVLKTGRRMSIMILFAACGLSLLGTIFIEPLVHLQHYVLSNVYRVFNEAITHYVL